MFGVPGVDMRQGRQQLHQPRLRHGRHLGRCGRLVVGIPAAAASTALAVACVRAVNAATARPTAAWAPPTAAVVGWNGCPSGGGARTLSSVLRPLHWLAVAATCWILTRSSPAFILGKFNSELQGGNSSQVEPTTAGPGDRSSC